MTNQKNTDEIKRDGFASPAWLMNRMLLASAAIIIVVFVFRLYFSHAGYTDKDVVRNNRLTLLDNYLVNIAATSSLFLLSATLLQGAIKKVARDEFVALAKEAMTKDLDHHFREALFAPLTSDRSKETSLLVTRDFTCVSELFIQSLLEAKRGDEILILNTWIPQLVESEFFRNALKQAWKQEANIRILMVNPYGKTASLRSESVLKKFSSDDSGFVKGQVTECLIMLNEIASEIDTEIRDNDTKIRLSKLMEVKLFTTLPSVSIYNSRQLFFVGTFLHGKRAIQGPQFAIQKSAEFIVNAFDNEFDNIWNAQTSRLFKLSNQGGNRDARLQLQDLRLPPPPPDS
jgi:hypothetical protein